MLKCKDVSRIIGGSELSDAPRSRRLATWIHLLMCRHCRAYAGQLRAIGAATRKMVRSTGPDPKRLADLEHSLTRGLRNRKGTEESDD